MSVAGIDFGNETNLVALARKRGIDVILNSESKRETPCVVGYGDKQRSVGVAGAAQLNMNPKNTIVGVKRLIGREFDDPVVAKEAQYLPFKIVKTAEGGVAMPVTYLGEQREFTPEQVLAVLLTDLRSIAELDQGGKVSDFVLSCPVYFNDAQRRAVLAACKIAGVNCLRLMNETTATALAYGIFKTDLPDKDKPAQNVAFVDVGHSALSICVVAFRKGELKVLSHAWDDSLGGRDFDQAMVDHFAVEFDASHKGLGDVRQNPRALLRLRKELEKVKKILSANPEAPVNVECLANDIDVRGHLTRDKFEELAASVLDRVRAPCEKALADSGLKVEDIGSLEVVGSASRIPAIVKTLQDVFKKDISRTMNASEAVCRGCALQCAMLSPVFKVRDFDVQDQFPFPVTLAWKSGESAAVEDGDGDGQTKGVKGDKATAGAEVFSAGNSVPSTKMLTFFRDEPFDISAAYAESAPLGAGQGREIGSFTVGPIPAPKAGGKAKVKVQVKLNLHGVVNVEKAQALEEEEYEVPKEPEPAAAKDDKDKDKKDKKGKGEDKDGAEAMDTDAKQEEPKPVEMIKKKRTVRTDIPVEAALPGAILAPAKVDEFSAAEATMAAQDRLMFETAERKNAVEEYVYTMRDKLYGAYEPFVDEAAREAFSSQLQAVEDWLYEDGEDETKAVYIAKLDELKAVGDPVVERYKEAETRPQAAAELRKVLQKYDDFASSSDEKYAHIEAADRDVVVKEVAAARAWLTDKLSQQEALPKSGVPCVFAHEITKKADTVARVCEPIMTKPKPKPPPPPAADEAKPAEGEAKGDAGGEAKGEDGAEPMDTAADGAGGAEGGAKADDLD